MSDHCFSGFPQGCFDFLEALECHNNREWFNSARGICEKQVYQPAQLFVSAMGPRLKKICPELVFDPRTNGMGSMFRLARDTRFSRDKSPFKTNLGFRFWLSEKARRAGRIGLYVHLDRSGVRVYGGAHRLGPEDLAAFRIHVTQDRYAAVLRRILAGLEQAGCELDAERLDRVPRGYAADHGNADLLRYKSLFAVSPRMTVSVARKPLLVEECAAYAATFKPLNDWFARALPLL